jgi:NADPH:quinone reductase-like Zn-dependent oxidoreductase
MRVARVHQHGGFDCIKTESSGTDSVPNLPSDQHVLVKIKAIGLNHLDTWVRRGVPGHTFPLPIILSSDATGVIEKVGSSVTAFKPNDRVIINPGTSCGHCLACRSNHDNLCSKWGLMGETTDGVAREYLAIHQNQLALLPAHLSFEQGACIPINYVTAWQMLVTKAQVKPGETILIIGAGSGVNIACLQIAKLFGLQIFVSSNDSEKLKRAHTLGAHRLINTNETQVLDFVKNHTAKQGVDVVVDHVGQETFATSIRCLKRGGRLVSCGATTGAKIELDWKLIFFKNLSLLGSTYGTRSHFFEVMRLFELNRLHPVVDRVLKFDEMATAHELLEQRKVFGKIVVTFS